METRGASDAKEAAETVPYELYAIGKSNANGGKKSTMKFSPKHVVIRASIALLSLCILPTTLLSKGGLLEQFQKRFGAVAAFTGHFEQEFYDTLLEMTSLSQGVVSYKKPGLMRWAYQKPDEMLIVIGREKIWIYEPDLENVTIQDVEAVTQMNSLSFLLKNENISLHFDAILPKTSLLDPLKEMENLYLKPKKPNANFTELQLGLNRRNFQIKQFVIVDAQENYRKITFSKLDYSAKIDDSQFHFVIEEGMEVIDETPD